MEGQFPFAQLELRLGPIETLVNQVKVFDFHFNRISKFDKQMNSEPLGFLHVLLLNSEPARKSSTSRMAACPLPEKRFFVGKIECACHENHPPSTSLRRGEHETTFFKVKPRMSFFFAC